MVEVTIRLFMLICLVAILSLMEIYICKSVMVFSFWVQWLLFSFSLVIVMGIAFIGFTVIVNYER